MSTMRTASSRGLGGSRPNRRGLTALDAAPELLLGRQEKMLVERIAVDRDLDPLSAAGDDRKNRAAGVGYPHVVLPLGHMFFGRRFLREIPGQHELCLEHRPDLLNPAIQRSTHPFVNRVPDTPLHVLDGIAAVALVP